MFSRPSGGHGSICQLFWCGFRSIAKHPQMNSWLSIVHRMAQRKWRFHIIWYQGDRIRSREMSFLVAHYFSVLPMKISPFHMQMVWKVPYTSSECLLGDCNHALFWSRRWSQLIVIFLWLNPSSTSVLMMPGLRIVVPPSLIVNQDCPHTYHKCMFFVYPMFKAFSEERPLRVSTLWRNSLATRRICSVKLCVQLRLGNKWPEVSPFLGGHAGHACPFGNHPNSDVVRRCDLYIRINGEHQKKKPASEAQ